MLGNKCNKNHYVSFALQTNVHIQICIYTQTNRHTGRQRDKMYKKNGEERSKDLS